MYYDRTRNSSTHYLFPKKKKTLVILRHYQKS